MKKDYLSGGAMADTADLIVLGAYYGTGNKGGMMSVFLMGVCDKSHDKFRTVAKCGNGHDDAMIARLQDELDMVKISKVGVAAITGGPSYLPLSRSLGSFQSTPLAAREQDSSSRLCCQRPKSKL